MTSQELQQQQANSSGTKRRLARFDSQIYKCIVCFKQFLSKKKLWSHEQTHYDDDYVCEICYNTFKTKKYLQRHTRDVHLNKSRFKCGFCEKDFTKNEHRKRHERVHTGEKPYECDKCEKAFSSWYSLSSHKLIHEDRKPFECTFCPYKCRDSSTLRRHQHRHLGVTKQHPCHGCDKVFTLKSSLDTHINQDHLLDEESKFECKICKKLLRTKATLKSHIASVHNKEAQCICKICNKIISNKHNLNHHMETHNNTEMFKCQDCNKTFKRKIYLTNHQRRHGGTMFQCDECKRGFGRKSKLIRHIQNVHSSKDVVSKCPFCMEKFTNKDLKQHIHEKHSNAQIYECDNCDFFSRYKKYLRSHILAHDQDLSCKICTSVYQYKNMYGLKLHYLKTHKMLYKPNGKETVKTKRVSKRKLNTSLIKIKEEITDEGQTVIQRLEDAEVVYAPNIYEHFDKVEVLSQNLGDITKELVIKITRLEELSDEFKDLAKALENNDLADNATETEESTEKELEDTEIVKKALVSPKKRSLLRSRKKTHKALELAKSLESKIETGDRSATKNYSERKTCEKDQKTDTPPKSKPQYLIELEERQERKKRKRENIMREREELAEVRRQYNERILEIAKRNENKEKNSKASLNKEDESNELNSNEEPDSINTETTEIDTEIETETNGKTDTETVNDGSMEIESVQKNLIIENGKINSNMAQCYVCYKVFETKEKLIKHCSQHFDVCNEQMIKKCPLCEFAGYTNFNRHLLKTHNLKINVKSGPLLTYKNGKYVTLVKKTNKADIKDIQVIPSVKNLNHRYSMGIDKERRMRKRKGTVKTELVKTGDEWVVDKKLVKIDYKKYLLPLDSAVNVRVNTQSYLEKMTRLNKQVKSEGYKILFPCDRCEQICTHLSALKAHYNIHEPRPKRRVDLHPLRVKLSLKEQEYMKDLRKFFDDNVKGSEADFEEFKRAFRKM